MRARMVFLSLPFALACVAQLRADPPHYATPEGAFLAVRAAIKERDWQTFFQLQHPAKRVEDAKSLLGLVCINAFVRPGNQAAQEILQRFHVKDEDARQLVTAIVLVGDKDEQELKAAFNKIIDAAGGEPSALIGASFAFVLSKAKDGAVESLKFVEAADIRDVKIDGDEATAVMFFPWLDGEFSRQLRFQRIDGSWYFCEDRHAFLPIGDGDE